MEMARTDDATGACSQMEGKAPAAKGSCEVEGCGGKILARGLCCRHYYQVKRHGHVTCAARRDRPRSCAETGCPEQPYARGLCLRHYQRGWRATRGPRGPRAARSRRDLRLAVQCLLPSCGERHFADAFCRLHYIKMRHLEMGAARVTFREVAQTVGWMMPEGQTA